MNKLIILAALIGAAVCIPTIKISPVLSKSLESSEVATIMVTFTGGNTNIVNSVENQSFKTRADRLNTLKTSLQHQRDISQGNIQNFLKERKVTFKSFWISNEISIKEASKELIHAISQFPEVEAIEEEQIVQLIEPKVENTHASKTHRQSRAWGIDKIKAPEAWRITNGTGVIIASIDGGVRPTHESLRHNHRADHGWFDPYDGTTIPVDFRGHGTHVTGTIVGSGGIGVAPGAHWIACRGCNPTGSCGRSELTACGEWALCPTNPDGSDRDCSKAPVLVSNSWGGSQGDKWYEPVTEAWIAGNIIPIFAQGNSGASCGSANSPGDHRRVIGVGSTNNMDAISSFSSRGPTVEGRIKPDISAPGEGVESAGHNDDAEYTTKSGTSMACPHIAGVTALLLSIEPDLTFGEVRTALLEGVDTNLISSEQTCAGIPDTTFPNHQFGFGRINAQKVVEAAKARVEAKARMA